MTTEAEDYFVHPYLLIKDYTSSGFAAGDCDDFATLVAAMLLSVGLTPRFLLWAQNADAPEAYTHITTALDLPRTQISRPKEHIRWIPLLQYRSNNEGR